MKKISSLVGLSVLVLFLLKARNISAHGITFSPSIRVDDDTTDQPLGLPLYSAYDDNNR